MRTLTTALAISVALLAAGCGAPDEAVPPGNTPTPSPSPTATETPPTEGELTVRGTVKEGVEAGCMILRAESGESYLLVGAEGDTPDVEPGAEVEVTGQVETSVASFCQQGTPLVVEEIRPG